MTDAEIATLINALPKDWRPFVELLFATGLRWAEATAPRSSDFEIVTSGTTELAMPPALPQLMSPS